MLNRDHLRREVYFKAVRSRGPGGQNVNKVSSAAVLYWDFLYSRLLSVEQKDRLLVKLAAMINVDRQLYVRSDEFRDLEQNKSRCLDKMIEIVRQALHVPRKRRATKPTYASKQKRHEGKKIRGEVKRNRKKVDY